MKKINKMIIKREIDQNPDLSYLGEFSSERGKFAIEHEPNDNRSYPYFNADNVENMKHAKQNYKRMMKYENQELCDYGVIAEAEILIRQKGYISYSLIQTLKSSGLWGLVSDGTEADFKEVEKEQLEELKDILKEFGFKDSEINKAKVERVE